MADETHGRRSELQRWADCPRSDRDGSAGGAAQRCMSPGEALAARSCAAAAARPPQGRPARRDRQRPAVVPRHRGHRRWWSWSRSAVQRIDAPGPLPADKVVIIAPGTDVGDIVDQLEQEGVIDSATLMTGDALSEGDRSKIKAGEYLFKQNASLRDVIDTLVSGKQILHAITIPEGLTSEQICDRLKRRRHSGRRHQDDAEGGHADARHLQVRARHDARADAPQHAAGADARSSPRSGRIARPTRRSSRPTKW